MSPNANELSFLPAARNDVEAALAWYEQQSTGLGREFLRCLEATLTFIQRYPLMYPVILGDYHRALIRRFPYVVIMKSNRRLSSSTLSSIALRTLTNGRQDCSRPSNPY